MFSQSEIIALRREAVLQSYNNAKSNNRLKFAEGDDKATAEYIFPNQMYDANEIVDKFYRHNRRVISIQKKTKVGADGLMIEIAKLLTTHVDDQFVVNPANVRIITGMSNLGWETDMIEKAPDCFKNKIFHHGKLAKTELSNLSNSLIIIDEIDTGDKEGQVLHNTLKEAGILDVKHMVEHNNRFVFISATLTKPLYHLHKWGDFHELFVMTIPPSYIGHSDFLRMDIVKEFYPLDSLAAAEKWIQEDILDNYGDDYRVHIVRVNSNSKSLISEMCSRNGVEFNTHTSDDRLSEQQIKKFFKDPLQKHIVLGVKGFFRRANLIPNNWKLRIGATHELHTKLVDNNVQIQGLVGRMTGYWKSNIEGGHKTGPHRTSIKAITEYEQAYNNPNAIQSYRTSGFKVEDGEVKATSIMLSPKNITNLEYDEPASPSDDFIQHWVELSIAEAKTKPDLKRYMATVKESEEKPGFYQTSFEGKAYVHSYVDAMRIRNGSKTAQIRGGVESMKKGDKQTRKFIAYHNLEDPTSGVVCIRTIERK